MTSAIKHALSQGERISLALTPEARFSFTFAQHRIRNDFRTLKIHKCLFSMLPYNFLLFTVPIDIGSKDNVSHAAQNSVTFQKNHSKECLGGKKNFWNIIAIWIHLPNAYKYLKI